jgi:hypothetical protein
MMRLSGWLARLIRRIAATGLPRQPAPAGARLGDLVRRRLADFPPNPDWAGVTLIRRLGELEYDIRSSLGPLHAIEARGNALAKRAQVIRRDLEMALAPDGALAGVLRIWPARWSYVEPRARRVQDDFEHDVIAVRDVMMAAECVDACEARLASIRLRHARSQPRFMARLETDLDLNGLLNCVDTASGARVAERRISLADQLLGESEAMIASSVRSLADVVPDAGHAGAAMAPDELEPRFDYLRHHMADWCEHAIGDAGSLVTGTAHRHLKRLSVAEELTAPRPP